MIKSRPSAIRPDTRSTSGRAADFCVFDLPANAVVGFEIVRYFIASAKTGCQANAKQFAQIVTRRCAESHTKYFAERRSQSNCRD
jgi:hypothetical protein